MLARLAPHRGDGACEGCGEGQSNGVLRSFRYPRYRWLWFSNLAGSAGRWTLVLILSIQLLQMTHSSFWVGIGLFLTQGPVIVLAPFMDLRGASALGASAHCWEAGTVDEPNWSLAERSYMY